MDEAWSVLCHAGVPLAVLDRGGVDEAQVRTAIRRVEFGIDELDPVQRDALYAWLAAWEHHWPVAFAEVAGDEGRRLLERFAVVASDDNRQLKLRRLAKAHLSQFV